MGPQAASAVSRVRVLLDLLAGGAPAEEFGAVAAEARRAGVAPDELAEIERATAVALRVRGALRQHRRREAELTALFDTVGDLAALRDLDAVLTSIVRRARVLLGTDTAYLTLPDEEAGDTYMRVTDGSVSPLFQHLRLELGEGLGGLVAQTATPYATPSYPTDERFRHTSTIDAGVLDEGLVAILGVPLVLGSSGDPDRKVIGVLFAADRSPRTFAPDEVALLCSLAAHAAIAIDTARALADTRATLAELAEANAVIRAHSAAMQRAAEAHDQLTDLVLRGGELSQVASAVAGLLGGAITLHDAGGRPLAAVGPGGGAFTGRHDPDELAEAVADSHATARAVPRRDRWVCAARAGQELLGGLVLHGRPELADADRRLFERAGVVTALLLLLRRSVAEAENRIRGELITDLLTAPDRDPKGLVERGRRLGVDLSRPHLLLVAEASAEARKRLAAAARQHLFGTESVSAEHAGAIVMLLPADDAGAAARAAAAQMSQLVGAPVTVGAAGPAAEPAALAAAHAEAARCLRALRVLGRVGDGACAAELGFLGVLLGDDRDVRGYVAATLGPLLDYDARRGTELIRTLRAYFGRGRSLTRAKDDLHVHVNTVVQRLDRIEALLGPDWNSPERELELQLALRLHLLTGEPGQDRG
ncbi:helix-turn-helix domain-containing protein [Streptomyces radicis]|uniref:GAF domain-containing protein n=1 Tax=Streptomyces radicis TaxID=1750517 RepID=A0A3A9WAA6_9ACTN|nr:helix-turn-helix domain-containing protein [Streptomyces radicis]RKN06314.1 GAF domain-containing protein [Streptomyces radicis]RKN18644.1 GAF domain-containing protein [Streptomyces radicis]